MLFFKAELDIIGINPFVHVPLTVLATILADAGKDKGPVAVCGQVNGKPYTQTLLRYKGQWRLYINTTMLSNSPKRVGELIEISIDFDPRDRALQPHPELVQALKQTKEADAIFQQLPPYRKKEIIRYIATLKSTVARQKNIERAIGFLLGKNAFMGRNPH